MRLVILVVSMLLHTIPAHAIGPCVPRDDVVRSLTDDRYKERLSYVGVVNSGAVVEIWTNPKTGTYSILVTSPDGISCGIVSGDGFTTVKAVEGEKL